MVVVLLVLLMLIISIICGFLFVLRLSGLVIGVNIFLIFFDRILWILFGEIFLL